MICILFLPTTNSMCNSRLKIKCRLFILSINGLEMHVNKSVQASGPCSSLQTSSKLYLALPNQFLYILQIEFQISWSNFCDVNFTFVMNWNGYSCKQQEQHQNRRGSFTYFMSVREMQKWNGMQWHLKKRVHLKLKYIMTCTNENTLLNYMWLM